MSIAIDVGFGINDLAVAYRKAKVDLYYSTDGRHLDLARYESDLAANLERLQNHLNDPTDLDFIDERFVGDYRIVPKSVTMRDGQQGRGNESETHIYSSPGDQWKAIFENKPQEGESEAKAAFRIMANCSIDMHVVSALWMREVGLELDNLLSDSARGNRLRKDRHGEYNPWSLGSFEKYLWPYRRWRDDGFNALEQALSEDKNVYCLTADATGFFHGLSPAFLLAPEKNDDDSISSGSFWTMLEDHHDYRFDWNNPRKHRIHRVFIESLLRWQKIQEAALARKNVRAAVTGLPVGLPASGLVANLALLEFDKIILQEIRPLYYGRYVDDVMLVWEDLSKKEKVAPLRNVTDVWHWFKSKSKHFQSSKDSEDASASETDGSSGSDRSTAEETNKLAGDAKDEESPERTGDFLWFCPPYHKGSTIEFSNIKNRLYSMGGSTGRNLLDTLRSAAEERSSEWRLMPELPNTKTEVGASVAKAKNIDGDAADSLSNLEGISMSRSNFAITLRNFEAFTRDIEHCSWADQRSAFFEAVRDYVLTPFLVFEMDRYFERVFNLALKCDQPAEFLELVKKYLQASTEVLHEADVEVSGISPDEQSKKNLLRVILPAWSVHLHNTITRSLYRTGRSLHVSYENEIGKLLGKQVKDWLSYITTVEDIEILQIAAAQLLGEGLFPDKAGENVLTIRRYGKLKDAFKQLFHRDLAEQPYREHLLPTKLSAAKDPLIDETNHRGTSPLVLFGAEEQKKFRAFFDLLEGNVEFHDSKGAEVATDQSENTDTDSAALKWQDLTSLWGLVFPTRPFTASELFDISNILRIGSLDTVKRIAVFLQDALLIARGYGITAEALTQIRETPNDKDADRSYVTLSTARSQLYRFLESKSASYSDVGSKECNPSGKVRVAISMFETPRQYISAALHEAPTLSAARYRALTRLVNQTMRLYPRPHYLVLGELALPPSWFNAISLKLASVGINLIAGVEYIHARTLDKPEYKVRNQVWASLRHTTLGHATSCVYKQDKQAAAHGERENLDREHRFRMEPEFQWDSPPIIRHDDHHFGILICSELTNINYRADFRGKIDTLFVPQWNQDLNTFTALVESAALDIHAHVVQVNNRKFGDTRIRVPAGDNWKRDLVQLKGGINDYLVMAELDLYTLRVFQTKENSASKAYKPLPDGFMVDNDRSRIY